MKTTRRTFFRLGGAAAGIAAFNIVPARVWGNRAPSAKIVLGMIGLGGMGKANLDAFLGLDDVVVRAVCDVDRDKRASAQARVDRHYGTRGCDTASDFRELCARPDIDAVMIATPDHSHAPIGIAAAQAGKDVYGETPFAHTREEGRELLSAVTLNRRVWQTGSWQRSQAPFRKAVAAVRGGRIGRIARVEIGLPGGGRGPDLRGACARPPEGLDWKAWLGQAPECAYPGVCDFHWRWVSAWGGGILADWIGHHGDIALWGAGKEAEDPVSVAGRGAYPQDGLYDTATAFRYRCAYRDGLELTVADGGQLEKGVGVRWIGRDGAWVWVTRGALEASGPDILAGAEDSAPGVSEGLHRDFIDCVRTRRTTLAPAEPAFRAASLGQLGDRAMREKALL